MVIAHEKCQGTEMKKKKKRKAKVKSGSRGGHQEARNAGARPGDAQDESSRQEGKKRQ